MVLDTISLLAAVPEVIFAGISKGGFGSGVAFVAGPILALIVDPALGHGHHAAAPDADRHGKPRGLLEAAVLA
jgi:uncharacterized membrane protein YfcA